MDYDIDRAVIVRLALMILLFLFFALASLSIALAAPLPLAADIQAATDSYAGAGLHLQRIGSYPGVGAEIAAYDPGTERLFVTTGSDVIEILDISDPLAPTQYMTFSVAFLGPVANSVAVSDGYVAVAVEADPKQDPGAVAFYDAGGVFVASVTVGALPDMVTFTPDGQKVLVANEGEPDDDYLVDPEGSVSVIDVSDGVAGVGQSDVTTISFAEFNAGESRHGELDPGVRIFGPGASVAQDLEPEYIAVSYDSQMAWVTLQENNAVAVLDLGDNSVTAIKALGTKDYTLPANQLDPSNEDGGIRIDNWPVKGMYMPDAIASFEAYGQTYLLTANEGDAREYLGVPGYEEEARVADVVLDPAVFTADEAAFLQAEENLGRLKMTTTEGEGAPGTYAEIYGYGGRSFSIWSAAGDLVYDSGSDIGRITAAFSPDFFNSQGDASSFDDRSDDKGAEPEGVTKGVIDGRTYAFVGLERIGGIMVYDVTHPMSPHFVEYVPPYPGDVSPEGLIFIPAAKSPNGQNLLVATYEVSGTTAIFSIAPTPQLSFLGTYAGDGAEIAAYDPASERLFVTSGSDVVDILDISNPLAPVQYNSFSVSALGDGANSVAVSDGYAAVAVQADDKTDPGLVAFYDMQGSFAISVTVGALPDMVTFTPDGQKVVVANEGEPDDDYLVDPEGSVSVIDVSGGIMSLSQSDVTTIGFADFNVGGSRHGELGPGVRIFGPGATVAQDLEPEYVAISADSQTAWVTLQENNAVAVLDLATNTVTAIKALGTKDHSLPENQLDASNEDGRIHIANWPAHGMYMPDAIASFQMNGSTYLLTANEGDAREYEGTPGYVEETRVKDVVLDPAVFTADEAAFLQAEENMGRLKMTTTEGESAPGTYAELYSYGARSFSIWSASGDLVHDSGSQIAAVTAVVSPDTFNSQGAADSFDDRSDDKGAEPEGITKGVVDGRTYAFVGLERIGGILVYDVTDPLAPLFIQYQPPVYDDISPEGLIFIPAGDSPLGRNLLVVTYEVSGTTTIFKFDSGSGLTKTYLPVASSS